MAVNEEQLSASRAGAYECVALPKRKALGRARTSLA